MNYKKRIAGFFLTVLAVFALTACADQRAQSSSTQSKGTTENKEIIKESSPNSNGKVLVAYFSQTGTTKGVAETIAQNTGADLAEIQRAKDYDDLQEEAKAEIDNKEHPKIKVNVDDISSYDTIFVGYPIWWDEAPAMIATFLADNEFSGKTIVPFCTSASDDIGNSLHIFEELCPDAVIAEGLTANNSEDIEPWLDKLGLLSK